MHEKWALRAVYQRSRLATLIFGVLAVATAVVWVFIPATGFRWLDLALKAALAALFVASTQLDLRRFHRPVPAGFLLSARSFVAPYPPRKQLRLVFPIGFYAVLVFGGFSPGRSLDTALIVVGILVVIALLRPPMVRFEPTGLTVRRFGTTVIPWDALAPGRPTEPLPYYEFLWLAVDESLGLSVSADKAPMFDPPAGHTWFPIRLDRVFADRNFLAFAIGHYRTDPEARASIGTAEGHELLLNTYERSLEPA